ncbi:MAG: ribbon-helix-helix domain-containing protein [Acidimicrobiales bacterium]
MCSLTSPTLCSMFPSHDASVIVVMYTHQMRRLQINIDEELDETLAAEAARRHMSRAALIREVVRERLGPAPSGDPMGGLVGDIDDDAGDIDSVVYGT